MPQWSRTPPGPMTVRPITGTVAYCRFACHRDVMRRLSGKSRLRSPSRRRPLAFWRSCYERIERSPLRYLRLIGVAEKLGLVRRVWLNFEAPLGEYMLPFLRQLRSMKLPCICFTLHSSSLMAGGNSYTPTKECEDRLFAKLEEVLGTIAGWDDFRSATVTEVATQLEKEHHARTWN